MVASLVLLVERMTCRKKDFATCHKYKTASSSLGLFFLANFLLLIILANYLLLIILANYLLLIIFANYHFYFHSHLWRYNAAIGCLTIIVIIVNILATAFGGPDNDCTPNVSALE